MTWQHGDVSDCWQHECNRTAAEEGYCIAPRCYCGGCEWYVPMSLSAKAATLPRQLPRTK